MAATGDRTPDDIRRLVPLLTLEQNVAQLSGPSAADLFTQEPSDGGGPAVDTRRATGAGDRVRPAAPWCRCRATPRHDSASHTTHLRTE